MISLHKVRELCFSREKLQPYFQPQQKSRDVLGEFFSTLVTLFCGENLPFYYPPSAHVWLPHFVCVSHRKTSVQMPAWHIHINFKQTEIEIADGGSSFIGGVLEARRTLYVSSWCCTAERTTFGICCDWFREAWHFACLCKIHNTLPFHCYTAGTFIYCNTLSNLQ